MAAKQTPGLPVPQFTAVAAAQFTVGTTAAALTSTATFSEADSVGMAALQADPANSGTIKLGDATAQYVTLSAGDWFPFLVLVDNLSAIWADGSAADQKLNAIIFK